MSDKGSGKSRRRSSSSSSYSSTSSESSRENSRATKSKTTDKSKEQPIPTKPVAINKVSLDIGYKIQQEELSDSDDSDRSSSPLKLSSHTDVLKYPTLNVKKTNDRPQSKERRNYRSPSSDKRNNRSPSKDSRKERSQSKDFKRDLDFKVGSKYVDKKTRDRKDRSKSRDRKRERSISRDKKKKRSRSRERKVSRSSSRDKRKERSRSRDRKRSKSKDRPKDKRRERSRSREKRRERPRRASRSPSYYKDRKYRHSKRDRSRERSSRRSRSRSRSRSRPHKRSRSRSRSFDRAKRLYDKKINKLSILEKLGIELKVPEGQLGGEGGGNASGFSIPSYYNAAGVNPLKYAQQMQKRKLIWGSKKQEGESSVAVKKEAEEPKPENAGPESVWKGTTFSQDQDGKLTAKFKRLMGIKDAGGNEEGTPQNSELIQKQEEMFSSMEKQYEVARVSTHTHRGLGLGFGVHLPR